MNAAGGVFVIQVRHDRRVGGDSAVRFMTDGVLMRQLQSDFLLRSYSVILLDEAHERSLNTDLLLGGLLGCRAADTSCCHKLLAYVICWHLPKYCWMASVACQQDVLQPSGSVVQLL